MSHDSHSFELNFQFSQIQIEAAQVIEAARHFKALRYSAQGTWSRETEAGARGWCDCAGLFLLVARRLQLCALDPNLPPAQTGMSREDALKSLLFANFERVEGTWPDDLATGDLLILKWPSQGAEEFGRHMAIWTGEGIIHSMDDASGRGGVRETALEAHEWAQVWRVYRLQSRFWRAQNGT